MRISDWSSDVCSSDLNFILASLDEPSDALLLDDRAFYACAAGISLTTHRHQTVAGVLSGNGLVQPKMSGKGVFAVEAPVPVEEIDTVELDGEIGRAHVCTPVTNAHLVCRLLLEKQKNTQYKPKQVIEQ